jgi:hypothetical protein
LEDILRADGIAPPDVILTENIKHEEQGIKEEVKVEQIKLEVKREDDDAYLGSRLLRSERTSNLHDRMCATVTSMLTN